MAKQIISTPFSKKLEKDIEFEIFTIESLYKRYGTKINDRPERLNFYLIIYIEQGRGRHRIDFESYEYSPGTIFFLSPGRVQQWDIKRSLKGSMLLFTESFLFKEIIDKEFFENFYLFSDYPASPRLKIDLLQNHSFQDLIHNLIEQSQLKPDFAKAEILRSLLRLFILKAERLKRPEQEHSRFRKDTVLFNHFKKLLNENYTQTRNVSFYAERLHVSERKLSSLARSFTGRAAKHFINERTILETKRLLAYTTQTVKQICFDLGFDEPTNFVKFFKRYTNSTPQLYRSQFQK